MFIHYIFVRYSKETIETKVTVFRKMLLDKEGVTDNAKSYDLDENGRPM